MIDDLTFVKILSTKSVFGTVWKTIYKNRVCATKMLILRNGIHFNGTKLVDRYGSDISVGDIPSTPFLLNENYNKKSVRIETFEKEIENLKYAQNNGFGPKLYNSFIYKQQLKSHGEFIIGFITMQLADIDLDEIVLKRKLTRQEDQLIYRLINTMHLSVVHLDLKPANIGVYLNKKKQIIRAVILDFDKIKTRSQLQADEFKRLKHRDIKRYVTRYRRSSNLRDK